MDWITKMLEDINMMWDDFKIAIGYMPTKIKIFVILAGVLKIAVFIAAINFGASISRLLLPSEKALLLIICFGWFLNNFFINEVKDWSKNRK
jgi:hypothetical protein